MVLLNGLWVALPPLILMMLYDQDVAQYRLVDLAVWAFLNACLGGAIGALASRVGRSWRLGMLVCVWVLCGVNILYAISMYEQGKGFNALFWRFFRLDIISATHAYMGLFCVCVLYFLFIAGTLFWQKRKECRPLFVVGLVLFVSVGTLATAPVRDLIFYMVYMDELYLPSMHKELQAEAWIRQPAIWARITHRPHLQPLVGHKPLNVVWIYVESFEQAYFEDERTKPKVHDLATIRDASVRFTHMVQVPVLASTGLGLFASACGLPHTLAGNFVAPRCFMKLLAEQGYETMHIQGAVKEYNDHATRPSGYHTFWGRDEITPFVLPRWRNHFWGIYDAGLIIFAKATYQRLSAQPKPFALTLLTVDNHTPANVVSPSCARPHGLRPFDHAAACTSQNVADLIRFIRSGPYSDRTVIVVASDHLHPQHSFLGANQRYLTFFINMPSQVGGEIEAYGTHFDMAPTVLEAMGFSQTDMGFGHSLWANEEGYFMSLLREEPEKIKLLAYVKRPLSA